MDKIIQINPILMKPTTTTRKKKETPLKKEGVLKFIRHHQDNGIQPDVVKKGKEMSEYEKSINYLMNLKGKEEIVESVVNAPLHGCLKNGTLPTYRQLYKDSTVAIPITSPTFNPIVPPTVHPITSIPTSIKKSSTFQKKTLRRTFKIGKSIPQRKVSVLVSNKTLRHEISDKSLLLKQASIIDVRRHLVKHGLIKIGSIAPPDVLRKIYESSQLCGDVKNNNPELTMFNYMNN